MVHEIELKIVGSNSLDKNDLLSDASGRLYVSIGTGSEFGF